MPINLTVPISEGRVRSLAVGNQVLLSGVIYAARDAAHKYLIENFIKGECPSSQRETYENLKQGLEESVIFHCSPVFKKHEDGHYEFLASGPTTSVSGEPYQADVIAHCGVRAVISTGGVHGKTSDGYKTHGAVYLHAIGGATTQIAGCCREVLDVYKFDNDETLAFWKIRVEDFPCVVTVDTHGGSLYAKVKAESEAKLKQILSCS